MNIVENFLADPENCAFDQPCKFGNRVEGHAVYCHNDKWADSPQKCRRTWHTNGKIRDENCPGFQPNPEFTGLFAVVSVLDDPCTACKGMKVIKDDQDGVETCRHCMGDGGEPRAIVLSLFEQDVLTTGLEYTGKYPARGARYVVIDENGLQRNSMNKLDTLNLIEIHEVSWTRLTAVYLISLTQKGSAVLHAIWKIAKK